MQDFTKKFFTGPLTSILLFFSRLTGSLGLGIILLTLVIRLILIPFTLPSMKMQVKMRDLQPELNKLKAKYKNDKAGLQKAQMALFQQHKVNPASGCLPLIVQFAVLIALYRVLSATLLLKLDGISTQFLWLDLTKPDPYYIFPIFAGVTQLILSMMILPGADASAEKTLALATPGKTDDHKAEDMGAMAATMQKQMVFMMPVMTVIIALKFPSGLTLYWITTTLFSIVQQYFVSGWGAAATYYQKITSFASSRRQT